MDAPSFKFFKVNIADRKSMDHIFESEKPGVAVTYVVNPTLSPNEFV